MAFEKEKNLWWKTGVIYQVYPWSFKDSNNDGIGDLQGIIEKLDYLKWLGVKAIWISPIYPSPMADFGYDIADYKNIHPVFGTIDDFDQLLNAVHQRAMKLILDLVPNHTSDRHPWFIESSSSIHSDKRDWYIWHDAKADGSPPNNWLSVMGGSAWQWDEKTRQYYYHAFLKEQPDLNWRNIDVQNAMLAIMRYWLDKGVDGFRVDVMWHMLKDKQLRDNPINPDYIPTQLPYHQLLPVYSTDQPEVHEIVAKMRQLTNQYEEKVLIGEIYLPIKRLVTYYGVNQGGTHLPFNFQLLTLPWDAREISIAIDQYEGALPEGAWPNWVLSNHDKPRIVSRIGLLQAKVAAMLLLTLRGTPTLYYGDEIGMPDVDIPADEIRDPKGINKQTHHFSRDPARTPMQWNSQNYAGFSSIKPWLRVDDQYKTQNVETEMDDPYSMLSLHRKLILLRNRESAINRGHYRSLYCDQQLIIYLREDEDGSRFLIALNLTSLDASYSPSKKDIEIKGIIVVATTPTREGERVNNHVELTANEGIVIRLID